MKHYRSCLIYYIKTMSLDSAHAVFVNFVAYFLQYINVWPVSRALS